MATAANLISLNSGFSIQNIEVRQHGELLAVNFGVKYSSQMNAGNTYVIGTLKPGYRPVINSGGASATFREIVGTDGRVYVRPATNVNAGSLETFSIMYLLGA